MNAIAMTPQRRSRLQLILLAALFIAPVASAWLAWKYAVSEGVSGTTNAGELIQPARPLAAAPGLDPAGERLSPQLLTGRWSYVLLAGESCGEACMERLYVSRQLRTSVNKDMSRVQRVLVLTRVPADLAGLRESHPDLQVAVLDPAAWRGFSAQFTAGEQAAPDGTLYLVDPLGNLMMRYLPDVSFKGMFKDLRKLLKASQVG